MNVKTFVCNMLEENCYVVSDATGECAVIDCGAYTADEHNAITSYIAAEKLKPVHLIATHGHLDHNLGNDMMMREYGLAVELSTEDSKMIANAATHARNFYGMELGYELPQVGKTIADGDEIKVGNHTLKVIATPGHSAGSVVLYCAEEDIVFTGDTLFRMSIGRTDLGGGSMMKIIQSLRRLAQLPDKTVVYPGHGPRTTIGDELRHNPFMER